MIESVNAFHGVTHSAGYIDGLNVIIAPRESTPRFAGSRGIGTLGHEIAKWINDLITTDIRLSGRLPLNLFEQDFQRWPIRWKTQPIST